METDKSIGPAPNVSDFRPTKHPSPLASPEPTPRLLDNPITPSQPVCTPPKPTITPSNSDVAPSVRTPATRMPTEPHTRTPSIVHGPRDLSALRSGTSNPWSNLSCRHSHIHPPRDLSVLRSSTPNPWESLRRRHYGRDPHAPHQFTCCRQRRQKYPVNTYVHTTPTPKPPAPTPACIFETVWHPCGIGPNKPVIRVPTRMTRDTPAHHIQHMDCAIVKPTTPLPPSHSIAAIRCKGERECTHG
jgi:hypothetical protein